jgi:hypothetical protein
MARLKKILKLSSPQRVQFVRLRTRSITDSLHSRLSVARRFPGRGLDPVLAVAYERRSSQWWNVFDGAVRICKKTILLGNNILYYDETHSPFGSGSWCWLARSTEHLRTGKEGSGSS